MTSSSANAEPHPSARPALIALLSNIIDYAGLFPPAKLDMAATVRNYAAFRRGPHSWMLGTLIIPVSRLDEFEEHAADLLPSADEEDPWEISALTAAAGDDSLPRELERIAQFHERFRTESGVQAIVDIIELRADSVENVERALDVIPDEIYPFFEIPVDADPRGLITALAGNEVGAKIRTGGVTPELYPGPLEVARFISACAAADVPFKATAGLHHPLSDHSKAVGVDEFGFLNVFVAAALAMHDLVNEQGLIGVLEDGSIDSFRFDEEALRWREHRLTIEQIEDSRFAFAASFGSCSFEEPIADLQSLRLL